ncbi:hypothetical protein HK104_008024, partial [Borealophlyctis nickersoniae]
MERLMQEMYRCSVRVVCLEQGKEPIALLAHLENMVVVHRGRRESARSANGGLKSITAPVANGGTLSDPLGGMTTEDGWTKSIMYHIRTDTRYKTTRAIQVPSNASCLVSRDCFFILSRDSEVPSYLWVGRGPSKDEVRRAHLIVKKILLFWGIAQPDPPSTQPYPLSRRPSRASSFSSASSPVSPSVPQDPLTSIPLYKVAPESTEPAALWSLFIHGRTAYASGTEHYYITPPRFLRCSCTLGYFSIESIQNFAQSDLKSTSCVILDPGAPKKCFV